MTITQHTAHQSEVRAVPETSALLDIRDLHVRIPGPGGGLGILNGVNLTVAPGEAVGVVGESGSGKSMTAMAVLGLLPPRAEVVSGSIHFQGAELTALSEKGLRKLRGDRIGTILQDPTASLNPVLRIGWQVGEPLAIHAHGAGRDLKAKVVELLTSVGIDQASARYRDYPHQFSGGMRQRIVGASAIACEPALIIADEPTTALDVTVQARYLDLLERLQHELGAAMLFISHDLSVVGRLCQRVAVMYGGRIVETAPTEQLFAAPRHPYTIGLIGCLPSHTDIGTRLRPIEGQPPHPGELPPGCPFAPRCPAKVEACDTPVSPVDTGDGHAVACVRAGEAFSLDDLWPPQTSATTAASDVADPSTDLPPVVELRDVHKVYGGRGRRSKQEVRAVQGVSLTIRRGVALSLVGQSGSGKTTCARMVLGLEDATTGEVMYHGEPLTSLDKAGWKRYRRTLQAVFQDPYSSFNPRISLGRAVAEPLIELEPDISRDERDERVSETLRLVGLDPQRVLRAYPHQLSGGQRQRVAIARALVTGPECLVLDEPVSALDVSVRLQVMNLLRDIQERTGLGYLMISHDLASVKYLSDEVAVMYDGQIVEHGTARQVYEDPQHPYTQQLLKDALLIPR